MNVNGDSSLPLLPAPSRLEHTSGAPFLLTPITPLRCQAACAQEAEQLAELLRNGLGWCGRVEHDQPEPEPGPPLQAGGEPTGDALPALRLDLDEQIPGGPEAYALSARADGLELRGASPSGVLQGVRTLLQLLPRRVMAADGATWAACPPTGAQDGRAVDEAPGEAGVLARIPPLSIEDAPRFGHRGLMLDVARSFLGVEDVCAIVEAAGRYKINVLHLHLVDDQGWRLEITNEGRAEGDTIDYTRLTAVSGRTAVSAEGYGQRPGVGGFYTREDYRRILDFCRSRHVEVIPEIDLPGHAGAALHAIPELCTPGSSYAGTPQAPTAPADGSTEVGRSYLDPHSPATLVFLRHVLTQVAGLDPHGRTIHLGGDEPYAMAHRYGAQEGSPYAGLLAAAQEMVRELGREPMGWNEAVSAGPRGILQVWNPEPQVARALRQAVGQGSRLVMSPVTHAYVDLKYDPSSPLGLTWAGSLEVPQARSWDPARILEGVGAEAIDGVEATLWGETVRSRQDAEWLLFPRLLALAEVGWCIEPFPAAGGQDAAAPGRSLEDFLARCAAHGPRLAAAGTRFHATSTVPWGQYGPFPRQELHPESEVHL
ncbi:family 20 glycosylhydrolase [Actinomyces capricornis]|nr:family 20 glycosylhydrolase [Actinomyces capricornis]